MDYATGAPIHLWCIHGNFQSTEVWQSLQAYLDQLEDIELEFTAVSVAHIAGNTPHEWASTFSADVEKRSRADKNILLGYSMGGRLAMCAVVENPQLWSTAVFVSADPGLASAELRENQLQRDRDWSERIRSYPIGDVMEEWNAQPVFNGRLNRAPVDVEALDAKQLARDIVRLSKGRQDDLRSALHSAQNPIVFVSGADDLKYVEIGTELSRNGALSKHVTVENSGHRVPWDNPNVFNSVIRAVLLDEGNRG